MGPSWLLELPSTVLRKPEPLAPRKSFLYLEFALLSYPPLLLESPKKGEYLANWARTLGAGRRPARRVSPTEDIMGLLTFSINVTLDGCVDHQEGIADDEIHAFFTRLMDEGGAMLWGPDSGCALQLKRLDAA
jgi:hypothetical protein